MTTTTLTPKAITWPRLTWEHAFWLVFIIGATLRFINLGKPGLWYDETGSTWMASLPLPQLIQATAGDVHPPLSMLLIKPFVMLFGPQSWAVRMPSAILGGWVIWLVRKLGERLSLSLPAITIGAAFTAFSPFQLYFSQEARMYALLEFCIVVSVIAMLDRRWWLFILATTAAMYSHNYGVIYLAVVGPVVILRELVRPMGQSRVDYAPLILAAPVLLWLPWFVVVLNQMHNYAADWITPLTVTSVLQPVIEFIWPSFAIDFGPWLGASVLALMLLIYTTLRVIAKPNASVFLMAWMVIGPMLLAASISLTWRPMYLFRAFIGSAPFFYLLIGWAVSATPKRAVVATAAFIPLFAVGAFSYYPNVIRAKDTLIPPRDVAHDILSHWRVGDVVYHGNVGTLMPMWPVMPADVATYLMPVQGDSLGMLRPTTREAMGMNEQWLEAVQWKRAWLVWSAGPTIAPEEDAAITRILNTYPHQQFRFYQDEYSKFGLWLLYNPKYAVGMAIH